MIAPTLTTERLTLRPLERADAAALLPLHADPQLMRFVSAPLADTVAGVEQAIGFLTRHADACMWAVTRRDTGEVAGFCGFFGGSHAPNFAYGLMRPHQRQGFAREACAAAIRAGGEALGLDRCELFIHEGNAPSLRLAEALGFAPRGRLVRKMERDAHACETVIYGKLLREPAAPYLRSLLPTLEVPDVAAAAAFYRDELGFHVDYLQGDPPAFAALSQGLWSADRVALQLVRAAEARPSVALQFGVARGIDELFARCQARGLELAFPLKRQAWGALEFGVKDPAGYVLRFFQPD